MQLYCLVFPFLIILVLNHTEILNVYLKSRERGKGEREKRIWKISPFATWQRVSLGGWLRCHSFVGAPICLIFHLYSGKQSQAAAAPLLLFLHVHLRHSAQPWTTSSGFGDIWPRWKFLLVAPTSQQHMDTCFLSTSPIIPHSIASSIKSQNLPTPPPPNTWGGLKARV